MDIKVIPISAEHAEEVAILSDQLGYPATTEAVIERIARISGSTSDIALGAFSGNQLLGWIHVFLTVRLETDAFCEIGGLVVDERSRGAGIGRLLVSEAITWTKGKGCRSLRVRSNVLRLKAHNFYLQNGFASYKEQKVFEMIIA